MTVVKTVKQKSPFQIKPTPVAQEVARKVLVRLKSSAYRDGGCKIDAEFVRRIDKDGSGTICFEEWLRVLRKEFKLTPSEVSNQDALRVFQDLDPHGRGDAVAEIETENILLALQTFAAGGLAQLSLQAQMGKLAKDQSIIPPGSRQNNPMCFKPPPRPATGKLETEALRHRECYMYHQNDETYRRYMTKKKSVVAARKSAEPQDWHDAYQDMCKNTHDFHVESRLANKVAKKIWNARTRSKALEAIDIAFKEHVPTDGLNKSMKAIEDAIFTAQVNGALPAELRGAEEIVANMKELKRHIGLELETGINRRCADTLRAAMAQAQTYKVFPQLYTKARDTLEDVETKDGVRQELQEAISHNDLGVLRAAIRRARTAGLGQEDLRHAEAIFMELMWIDRSRQTMEAAMRARDAGALQDAIDGAENAGVPDVDMIVPKTLLKVLTATRSGHIMIMLPALAEAQAAQLDADDVENLQAAVAVEMRKIAARANLQVAMMDGHGVDAIEAAVEEGFDAGLAHGDLADAIEVLQSGQAEALSCMMCEDDPARRVLKRLEQAVSTMEVGKLLAALAEAECVGLHPEELAYPRQALQEEEQRMAARAIVQVALQYGHDPERLENAMTKGIIARLNDEELAPLAEALVAAEREAKAEQEARERQLQQQRDWEAEQQFHAELDVESSLDQGSRSLTVLETHEEGDEEDSLGQAED
eukprot:TRINITY_DN81365_c0_g1_i1.p1 TRINITY_DN81365_c0_g1~~TRINITY_DN81365_c0_g1_i1.p1  ORF type:complete len:705 (+),score=190.08 TRINITY_DN81365_c0_g1_i1:163-2277(+)